MGFLVDEAFPHTLYNRIKEHLHHLYAFSIIVLRFGGRHGVCASTRGFLWRELKKSYRSLRRNTNVQSYG